MVKKMKPENIKKTIENIEMPDDMRDRIIEVCRESAGSVKEKGTANRAGRRAFPIMKIAAAAICILLAVGMFPAFRFITGWKPNTPGVNMGTSVITKAPSGIWIDNRAKKAFDAVSGEIAIDWNWEDRPIEEQYPEISYNQNDYVRTGVKISEKYIGKKLGTITAQGKEFKYHKTKDDEIIIHTTPCEIYEINGISSEISIAVKLEGTDRYSVFKKNTKLHEYDHPATLGEFIKQYNLTETLCLNDFYYFENGDDDYVRYALSEKTSDYIWKLIEQCGGAVLIPDTPSRYYPTNERVSFACASEPLGIINKNLSIDSSGYIYTNIADYGYDYYIGTDAAKQIIDYANANVTHSLPLAYEKYIVGTVTKIGVGYFKINDAVSLVNPKEGIEFTIDATDIVINRYIKRKIVSVGATIIVKYRDELSLNNYTYIKDAYYIDDVYLDSDGNFIVLE